MHAWTAGLAGLLLLTACASAEAPVRESASAGCPDRAGLEVPAEPTTATAGRLVPEAVPDSAVVCRYADLGPDADDAPLVGQVPVTDLGDVPTDLLLPGFERTPAAGACISVPGPITPVLLRLAYADGVVWVAATEQADPCRGAGNGRFRSGEDVGDVLVASADAGTWTVPPLPDAEQRCVPDRTGRRVQDGALLPAGAQSLVLCRVAGDGVTRRTATAQQAAAVQDVLDEPVAVTTPRACPGGGEQYEIAADYGTGPVVLLRYDAGCDPDVDNGSLRADLDPAGRARLDALLQEAFA